MLIWLIVESMCVLIMYQVIMIQVIIGNATSPHHLKVNSRTQPKVLMGIHEHVLPLARVSSYSTLHLFVFLLADILAVGAELYGHNKAEIFNDNNNSWSRVDDYPFDLGST